MPPPTECWDALDREGRPLGFDLTRGSAIPPDVFHAIVEVYTVEGDGKFLVTRRGPKRLWPGQWEVTAGAVVRGESPAEGACRELEEETGLAVTPEKLTPFYRILDRQEIYHGFFFLMDQKGPPVRLLAGETVDSLWLAYPDFKRLIRSDAFVGPQALRFLAHESVLERLLRERTCGKMGID